MSPGVIQSIAYILLAVFGTTLYYCTATRDAREEPNDTISPLKSVQISSHRHSCRYCRSISIRFASLPTSTEFNILVQLQLTSSQVAQTAAGDCPLLHDAHVASTSPINTRIYFHILAFLEIFPTDSNLHAFTGCDTLFERALYFIRGLSDRPFHIRFSRLPSESGGTLYARVLYTASRLFEFDVSVDQDNHAARYVFERPLSTEVDSHLTFYQAKEWLFECVHQRASHPGCLQGPHDFAPTRLIKVSRQSDGSLMTQIIQSVRGEDIKWACLSYCWGGDQPSKTKKANLSSRLKSLPFAGLPKTIKDAIIVTDKIGLEFLWVDALCIIQDDATDVAHEIASMPEIYRYGTCTISASRASTSEDGFLQDHQFDEMHHKPISLHIICPDGTPGQIILSNRGSEYRYAQEPIHRRAWCYQERILSPRIIDFGHAQVQWICNSKRYADGGKVERAASTDALIGNALQSLSKQVLHQKWSDIVSKYTRRDITFAGDKLLAISAVAAYFAPLFDCRYLAGLWQDSLSLQLAWIAGRPKYPRSGVYVAPSWSWASISDSASWDMTDERKSAVHVLDCQVQSAHSFAPLGAVISGFLLLRAQMCEMTWYFNRNNRQVQVEGRGLSFMADRETLETLPEYGSTHFQGWVDWDALELNWSQDAEASLTVSCLKLRERSQKGDTLCIFLVPAHDMNGSFRRIASFRIVDALYRDDTPIDKDCFEGCEWQEVRIV